MQLLLIIFLIFITNLLLVSKDNNSDTLTLKLHCKLTKPENLYFDIANVVKDKNGNLYILPLVNFASQYVYKFEMKSCKYENTLLYPDNAKYCYIPASDTAFWQTAVNSLLSCYPCTFSFRAITNDISEGTIFASVYTLRKISDTGFLPVPLILRIDTTNIELTGIVSDTLWLLPLLEFGKKGNLLFCYGKKYLIDTTTQEYFIGLFDLIQKKHIYKVSLNELENKLRTKLHKSTPILYFLDDSLGICYWYSLSPPIIFNFKTTEYHFFEYKGILKELVNTNMQIKTINFRKIRKFMFHFYSMDNNLVVLGGENYGEKLQDFELIELFIQFYDKTTFELKSEKYIRLPNECKSPKFFAVFWEEKTREMFFIFWNSDYDYWIYSLNI